MTRFEGTAEADIQASPERCFEILTDFESYPEWYGCDRVRIMGREPAIVELTYAIPMLEIVLLMRFDAMPPVELRAELVEARSRVRELKRANWRLEPLGDGGTRARYELDLDVDVPRMLRALAGSRGRELLLEQPVAELKERAER